MRIDTHEKTNPKQKQHWKQMKNEMARRVSIRCAANGLVMDMKQTNQDESVDRFA